MSKLFGDYIRSKRETLRKDNPEFSIRKVSKRIGIHHSYLSKIERGEPASLSEKRMVALAEELGDNPDLLMAMNGKLSEDVRRSVCESPDWALRIIDEFKAGPNGDGSENS